MKRAVAFVSILSPLRVAALVLRGDSGLAAGWPLSYPPSQISSLAMLIWQGS
jgi:hypothetical protein